MRTRVGVYLDWESAQRHVEAAFAHTTVYDCCPWVLATELVRRWGTGASIARIACCFARPREQHHAPSLYRRVNAARSRWQRTHPFPIDQRMRPMEVRDGIPVPKGIQVDLALQALVDLRRSHVDAAIVMSHEDDLAPLFQHVVGSAMKGRLRSASWLTDEFRRSIAGAGDTANIGLGPKLFERSRTCPHCNPP
jgi:hypothetical protein